MAAFHGHTDWVNDGVLCDRNDERCTLFFSPGRTNRPTCFSTVLTASSDASIRLWNTLTGECLASAVKHMDYVKALVSIFVAVRQLKSCLLAGVRMRCKHCRFGGTRQDAPRAGPRDDDPRRQQHQWRRFGNGGWDRANGNIECGDGGDIESQRARPEQTRPQVCHLQRRSQ